MNKIHRVSEIVWKQCIKIKPNEKALIVTDEGKRKIARALFGVGKSLCNCSLIEMPKGKIHGEEPTKDVADAMLKTDAVIAPTSFSLTHTKAVRIASESGVKIITMPNIMLESFLRAIPIDYKKLEEDGEKVKKHFLGKNEVCITTKKGTDITLFIKNRKIHNCCGLMKKGSVVNLPNGEIATAPLEGKTEGMLVVDISCAPDSKTKFGKIGLLKKPFKIRIEKGHLMDCENPVLWKWTSSVRNGTNVAELGIGTNWKARICGNILEDEKCKGTAHIAFGTSKSLGGEVQSSIHLDCVFSKPTIIVDGKVIIKNGKFLL